jgi:hypothetical protein
MDGRVSVSANAPKSKAQSVVIFAIRGSSSENGQPSGFLRNRTGRGRSGLRPKIGMTKIEMPRDGPVTSFGWRQRGPYLSQECSLHSVRSVYRGIL